MILTINIATLYYSFAGKGVNLKTINDNNLPRAIEFSNNGVSDSLTGAPAPKTFFDNLAREISQSQRNLQSISIVTMKLLPENRDLKKLKILPPRYPNQSNLEFEKDLSVISNCIKSNMRGGDFYSRLAENGFWLCIQGNLEEATRATERIDGKISERLKDSSVGARMEFTFSEWTKSRNLKNWIDEIDVQFFSKLP